ncbi:hypothetical protein ANCCAN_08378 [Ancylostoma caninum]|uniref:Protection of telomeres protein 1 ssDNA-binding domain-containing protein n=1 Tax=Ancylostoma caninum TaxID=29170 RepID=A0A368GQS2_ANCCA|nr:hypothetical protein ANCCAN_08378 [Ancylostoma caninum]
MEQNSVLQSCIFNSSCLEQFYLKYFDWLVQVVSVRTGHSGTNSRRIHLLRVWDGHKVNSKKPRSNQVCTIINSIEEEFIVPPADQYSEIPGSYFFDVLLFGEWIQQAASLKSGAIVVLRNLHIFIANGYKMPILVMHEGTAYGRGIIKIQEEYLSQDHRCIKLKNDIRGAIEENKKVPTESEGQTKEVEDVPVFDERPEDSTEGMACNSFLSAEEPTSMCSTSLTCEPDAPAEQILLRNSSQALSLEDDNISEERLGQFLAYGWLCIFFCHASSVAVSIE